MLRGDITYCCREIICLYKISEIIRSAPWLSYNECLNYVICDKILFSDVKERMQEWAILEAIWESLKWIFGTNISNPVLRRSKTNGRPSIADNIIEKVIVNDL